MKSGASWLRKEHPVTFYGATVAMSLEFSTLSPWPKIGTSEDSKSPKEGVTDNNLRRKLVYSYPTHEQIYVLIYLSL